MTTACAPTRARLRGRGRAPLPAAVLVVALVVGSSASAVAAPPPASATEPGSAPWSWPVAAPRPVLRPFVGPEHPWSPGHRGIDVGAPTGSPVSAPDDGVVHFAGVVVDRPVLSLRHADGVLSSLEPVTTDLRAGDAVTRGQTIGTVVAGHCAEAECVHLGARVDGEYDSPLLLLGLGRPSVLLPTRRGRAPGRARPRSGRQARGWAER